MQLVVYVAARQLEKLFFTPLLPACKFDMHVVVTVTQPQSATSVSADEEEDGATAAWEDTVQRHAESVVVIALGERAALVRTVSATVGFTADEDRGDDSLSETAAILKAGTAATGAFPYNP